MFMTFRQTIVLVLVFSMGLLLRAAWETAPPAEKAPPETALPKPLPEVNNDRPTIPQLVARQLESGDLSCPASSPLTYEACLLYQGALGVWQRTGLQDNCPEVGGDSQATPFGSAKASPPLSPTDAIRAPQSACFAYLYAIQVANAVPVLISTANRTFRMAAGKPFTEPGSDAHLCLEARHGLCGNQAAVGIALFDMAGLKSRSLQFYYHDRQRLSHIIPEVLIDGDWRPVDTTYGAYWARNIPGKTFALETTDQVLRQASAAVEDSTELRYNTALLPHGLYSATGHTDEFNYLKPGASVLRDGKGEVALSLQEARGTENFLHRPNYLGDNTADGAHAGLAFDLGMPPGTYAVTIHVSGAAIGGDDPVAICIDQTCAEYSSEKKSYRIVASQPGRLHLQSNADVAYLVLASIEWGRMH